MVFQITQKQKKISLNGFFFFLHLRLKAISLLRVEIYLLKEVIFSRHAIFSSVLNGRKISKTYLDAISSFIPV